MTQIVDSHGFEKLAMDWVDEGVTGEYLTWVRKITLQLLRLILKASPVDKGRFVGSWDVTVGGFGADTLADGPGSRRAGEAMSNRRAMDALAALKGGRTDIPEYIGLTNALPYARKLEYEGHSKKSGAGFVRAAVKAMESRIRAGRVA